MSRISREEPSETQFEAQMLRELREEKRQAREPGRWEYALKVLKDRGFKPVEDAASRCISFAYGRGTVKVYPYTGWFTGKGIKDGRGIRNLMKQIS